MKVLERGGSFLRGQLKTRDSVTDEGMLKLKRDILSSTADLEVPTAPSSAWLVIIKLSLIETTFSVTKLQNISNHFHQFTQATRELRKWSVGAKANAHVDALSKSAPMPELTAHTT